MINVQDSIIIESYSKTGNIWKTGKEVGLSGQQVHSRLKKLGLVRPMNYWAENDSQVLLEKYQTYKEANKLGELAKELGRTKQFICRKAKGLGLTDRTNLVMSKDARKKLSESTKKWIKEKGHPKGFLGHKHDDKAKRKISQKCKAAWDNPNSVFNSEEFRQRQSDTLHNHKMEGKYNVYSIRGHTHCVIDGEQYIFKSSWEAEIAKRLQQLKEEGSVLDWDYEKDHFNFDDMKRGMRSYCPDFGVTLNNYTRIYIEVKGWKMEKSMLRIKMFQERYPNVKFYLIDEEEYGKIISESDHLRRRCFEI